MRPRTRAAGVVASLGITTMMLSAAMPNGVNLAASLPAAPGTAVPAQEPGNTPNTTTTIGATTTVSRTRTDPPAGALPADKAIRELRTAGTKAPAMELDRDGAVRSITAAPGETIGTDANGFVRRYAAAFGLTSAHTVTPTGTVTTLPGGDRVRRYQQRAGGLPVIGGELVVTTTGAGRGCGATTETSPVKPATVTATVSKTAARDTALAAAKTKHGITAELIGSVDTVLWLYDQTLLGDAGRAELRPTYWVTIKGTDGDELASVLVDALDGTVKINASEHREAKRRMVCDLKNQKVNLNLRSSYRCDFASTLGLQTGTRNEGELATGHVAEVNKVYDNLGAAYDYYKNNFQLDSFDGRGAEIRATVQVCQSDVIYGGYIYSWPCPYPNAAWEGLQFIFGQGFGVDDVAAHEFTHAVTEHASNLYYWHQSGAINEALSDIFGQFVDLQTPNGYEGISGSQRWLLGEELPGGAIRDMMNPNSYGHPGYMADPNWSPDTGDDDNGGVHTNSGVANRMAAFIADGTSLYGGISGIGLAKSAQLWYRVMHVLPSGADYEQLGRVLKTSCRELIGHYGVTPADCLSVDRTTQALLYSDSQRYGCDGSGQRPTDYFFDDMESGTAKWKAGNSFFWQALPNLSIPYSYAASGRGSINGWTYTGYSTGGHGTTFEMKDPVTLPAADVNVPLYLGFEQSLIKDTSVANTGVDVFIDNGTGTGWQPFNSLYGSSNRISSQSKGFGATRVLLNSYAGKAVKFKFQVYSPVNKLVDWYLDDFRIYGCDSRIPGMPLDAFAYLEGTNLNVSWSPTYRPAGNYHLEFAYDPPIPGAPTTYQVTSALTRYTITAPGADPNLSYKVTAWVHTDPESGAGLDGPKATMFVHPYAPVSCPTNPAGDILPPPAFRFKLPRVPVGSCTLQSVPRR